MKKYTVLLSGETAAFYEKVAEAAGFPAEKVMEDALFRLAGELSVAALSQKMPEQ